MRWSRGAAGAPAAAHRSVADDNRIRAAPEDHDSPGLAEIFSSIHPDRPCRVLDLSPAVARNFDFYSSFASLVRFIDLLHRGGPGRIHHLSNDDFTDRLARVLPVGDQQYDLILSWDLLNYLGDGQASILARHLAAVAAQGARLHAMIVTIGTMPAEPLRYELLDARRVTYRPSCERSTPSPNPNPADVERWIEPFTVERSFLLRHGVREFVGVYQSADAKLSGWFR